MLNFFKDAGISLSMDGDRLKAEGLKQLPQEQAKEIRQKIQDNREKIISELQIPEPSPPGLGPVYAELWNAAWRLADEIDDPDGAPLAERRAKLPELNALRHCMARMEQGLIPEQWFIVDAVKALSEIRATKHPKSKAMESVALILEGTPEKLPKKHETFVYAIGKAIKPVLAQVEKTARPKLAREVADFFRLAEDGHPVTMGELKQ